MKVVGISGAQGAGKTSLLTELEKRGYALDSFKVSRAVQTALGWHSLDEVMSSVETMEEFQTEVYAQKFGRDKHLAQVSDDSIVLTERTFADIDAYTHQWVWSFVDQGKLTLEAALEFLTPYHRRCTEAQASIYSGVILLPFMDHVVWQDDPNRAKRADVDRIYEHIERFMTQSSLFQKKVLVITAKSVEDRADQVEEFLKTL